MKWICHGDFTNSNELTASFATFQVGKGHGHHYHLNAEEIIYVVRGESQQALEDQEFDMLEGDSIHIPKGAVHWTKNIGQKELIILVVFSFPIPETIDL